MLVTLDHLVITVRDPDATLAFYVDALGMEARRFEGGQLALHFGHQKINVHVAGREFEPKATFPTPGSADLCFLTDRPLDEVRERLEARGSVVIEGPVARSGATGPLTSLYVRDPDGNLIEIAHPAA
jgi:catechol 2,3-dioxygenase-like lactoylglutathione lyase family enzyme